LLHAAPVPWPPDKVIDPASRPISGSSPSSVAMPIPRAFCSSSRPTTTIRKVPSTLPPARRLARLALRPMVAKNASISGSFRLISKSISISMLFFSASSASATSRPPATGSGIVYFLRKGTVCTSFLPSNSTSVAATSVDKVSR
jgi:hypothetical protein